MKTEEDGFSTNMIYCSSFTSTVVCISINSLIQQKILAVVSTVIIAMVITEIICAYYTLSPIKKTLCKKHKSSDMHSNESELPAHYRDFIEIIIQHQEKEKKQLAQDLHDDTIQRLIIIGHKIQLMRMAPDNNNPYKVLEDMENYINETVDSIRLSIKQLRPMYIDRVGLVASMEELVSQSKFSVSDVDIVFDCIGNPIRLNNHVEIAIYRIAQSAIVNAIRHSGGSLVTLKIEFLADAINLSITDNGKGFKMQDEMTLLSNNHLGIVGMKERADSIGAKLSISTKIAYGTKIFVQIPMKENVVLSKTEEAGNNNPFSHFFGYF